MVQVTCVVGERGREKLAYEYQQKGAELSRLQNIKNHLFGQATSEFVSGF
jgi:hypothetical protein